MTQPLKIGVLLSGSGTNLQALIDDIAAGTLNAEIVQVVSSRPDAYGIERAQAAGIPVLVMNKTLYADAEAPMPKLSKRCRLLALNTSLWLVTCAR